MNGGAPVFSSRGHPSRDPTSTLATGRYGPRGEALLVSQDENNALELAARDWYGYGRWNAPYWFIGPEPGRAKAEEQSLKDRCAAWLRLCKGNPREGALVDAYRHHKEFGRLEFFEAASGKKRVPTQATWRQLIRLLFAFQERPNATDNDAIADYQATKWGRANGETCVVELSALAMNSLSAKQDLRGRFRSERIARLRSEVDSNHPKFVVMYGGGAATLPSWADIAGFDSSAAGFRVEDMAGLPPSFVRKDGTTFVVTRHPVSHGTPDAYWVGIGKKLRSLTPP